MQLTLTGLIEAFILRQVAQGYKDADEVATPLRNLIRSARLPMEKMF